MDLTSLISIIPKVTLIQLLTLILFIYLIYKLYQFWTTDKLFVDPDRRVFKNSIPDEDGVRSGAQTYPNVWYPVIKTQDLLPGQVKPIYVLEKNFVVFRTLSGKICILDAFCPHLGANIGVGGSVVGEDIRCPFHSWTFNGDGICTSVPGLESTNIPKVKIKRWDCVERNGWVYLWYHDQNAKPTWFPKQHKELNVSKYCGELTMYLESHFINWYINTMDETHFQVVHPLSGVIGKNDVLTKNSFYQKVHKIFHFDIEFKAEEIPMKCKTNEHPHCKSHADMIPILFGYRLKRFKLDVIFSNYPPYFHIEIGFRPIGAKLYIFIPSVPIVPRRWRQVLQFYDAGNNFASRLFAKVGLHFFYNFGNPDYIISANIKTLKTPCFTKLDRCLAKFYRWINDNFFSPQVSVEFDEKSIIDSKNE